ncbi:hypothetical protein GQX74_006229 [Glossina fuscipes]|nr:hypothetical protein GQX74_006229 [Glossina fuscipes]
MYLFCALSKLCLLIYFVVQCEYVIVLVFGVSSSFWIAIASFLSILSSLDEVSSQSASFSTRRGFPVACVVKPPMVPLRDARTETDDLRLAASLTDPLDDDLVDGLATCLMDDLTVVRTDALAAGLLDAIEGARVITAREDALAEGLIVAALNMYKRSGFVCISSKSGNLNVNTNHGFSGSIFSANTPVSVDIASALACSSLIEYRSERLPDIFVRACMVNKPPTIQLKPNCAVICGEEQNKTILPLRSLKDIYT